MLRMILVLVLVVSGFIGPGTLSAQTLEIPEISEFLMDEAVEIALARSAAPATVSDNATIMVLGEKGYETRIEGTNGFVCLVLRSWGNPSYIEERTYKPLYRVPECFDANAVATILPMQLARTELAARGAPPVEINQAIQDGFASGRFRRTETVSFSYMLSNAMTFSAGQPARTHVMVYLPDSYSNELTGGLNPEEGVLFVEGGPGAPYTAAVVWKPGIDPAPEGSKGVKERDLPTLARPDEPAVRVMILSVFHFHNPNADYAQFEGIDVMAQERQREIEAVVEALAAFEPTKVAIERPLNEADSLNSDYRRYRTGSFQLTANEIHQLGFRLADRLGLERVEPVDFSMGMRLDSLFAYASEQVPGFRERFDAYIGEIVQLMNEMQSTETIGANLRFLNEPDIIRRTHEPYVVQATVGAGDGYVGARAVTPWYDRNLRIFANLARLASPGDRILLIIGAGHAPIIRHLIETHPDMELVEAIDFLP